VAGQTGSGKSIFLHNLILTLALQHKAESLQFLLIDTKRVELEFYRGLKQTQEVATTPERTMACLKAMCSEMDRRYQIFAEKQVRDIETYNKGAEVKLHRIVVVIEELADLIILCDEDELINAVTRLVVKARACGIHVVLATQRPEADRMTGNLRSNFQFRVTFAMASVFDSKMVLGNKGAETLMGDGDGIFRTNNGSEQIRFQSAMVTEEEIKNLVAFIKNSKKSDD
jgi:S-DNA-T family DNA segregation ATPase FtsK/SpoIIIE